MDKHYVSLPGRMISMIFHMTRDTKTEKFSVNFGTGQFSLKKEKARLEPFLNEYPGPDSNRHGLTPNGF